MSLWERHTSDEIGSLISGGGDLAVLPVGATEQHGPHLGTGTDTLSAAWVAERAAERAGALVLPAIPYGCSLGHTDHWPGTVSLHPATLAAVVVEVGRWALKSGIKKLIMFSGHATNGASLESAVLQLRYEFGDARFRQIGIWEISDRVRALYTRDGLDVHANRGETSLLMHAAPDMVRFGKASDVEDVTAGCIWSYAMPRTTPNGVVGRPTEASAADGAMMAEILIADFADFIARGLRENWPSIPSATSGKNLGEAPTDGS